MKVQGRPVDRIGKLSALAHGTVVASIMDPTEHLLFCTGLENGKITSFLVRLRDGRRLSQSQSNGIDSYGIYVYENARVVFVD